MAATRIIIRPNYLFARGLILFVLSRAHAPKSLSSDDSPRSIIIEMTIYRAGRDFNSRLRIRRYLSRFFSTRRAEDYASCSVRGEVSTYMDEKKKEDRGHGWKASRESRGFRTPARLYSVLVGIQDLRASHGKSSWAVCSPRKQVFERSARATGGKRLSTNLTVTNRIRRLTDF